MRVSLTQQCNNREWEDSEDDEESPKSWGVFSSGRRSAPPDTCSQGPLVTIPPLHPDTLLFWCRNLLRSPQLPPSPSKPRLFSSLKVQYIESPQNQKCLWLKKLSTKGSYRTRSSAEQREGWSVGLTRQNEGSIKRRYVSGSNGFRELRHEFLKRLDGKKTTEFKRKSVNRCERVSAIHQEKPLFPLMHEGIFNNWLQVCHSLKLHISNTLWYWDTSEEKEMKQHNERQHGTGLLYIQPSVRFVWSQNWDQTLFFCFCDKTRNEG